MTLRLPAALLVALIPVLSASSASMPGAPLSQYFQFEAKRAASNFLSGVTTRAASWEVRRPVLREQLLTRRSRELAAKVWERYNELE